MILHCSGGKNENKIYHYRIEGPLPTKDGIEIL